MSENRWVGVVGLGNVLVGDDAFGPYVVRRLEARYDRGRPRRARTRTSRV